jgi:hypothetical protein
VCPDQRGGLGSSNEARDTEFPCHVKLQRPFLWDPAVSPHLSVDFRITGVSGPGFNAETASMPGLANARVTAGNANATTGSAQPFALAMQVDGEEQNGLSTSYGVGCIGSNGVPRCYNRSLASLPNPAFGIGIRNAAGLAAAFLVIGFTAQSVTLPGTPGCNVLTTFDIGAWGVVLTDVGGEGFLSVPLYGGPASHGFAFRTQWLVLDPPANPLALVTSDAQAHVVAFF